MVEKKNTQLFQYAFKEFLNQCKNAQVHSSHRIQKNSPKISPDVDKMYIFIKYIKFK